MISPGWLPCCKTFALGLAAAAALPALARAQDDGSVPVGASAPAIAVVADAVAQPRGIQPSSHWIGLVVRRCDDFILKHLKLDGGLLIEEVVPDSPATKAGIEQHDILLALNDDHVVSLQAFMDFLVENKEKVIVLKLLHGGDVKTVEVTPVARPQEQFKFFPAEGFDFALPAGEMPEELQRWMKEFAQDPEKMRAWRLEGEPFRARFFHPGVLLDDKARVEFDIELGKLPDDVQVVVTKEGDKPAKITVKRGDNEWEVTEKQLDKLPADVRALVQKYLGPADRLGIHVEQPKWALPPKWSAPAEGLAPRVKVFAVPRPAEPVRVEAHAIRVAGPNLEKQLGEINGRLEKIEKALEKLSEQ